ncbi:MAG: 5-formyltetrahydrofolate cyclo-ligase [Oscillospiraceae bacterium]|nr:5-formyltetrahydrofolate cyclo-ligase [Oscillospiraceae bacterium]
MSIKDELRVKLKDKINALPKEYIDDSDKGITQRVLSMDVFKAARNLLLYYSVEREPLTHEIATAALLSGKAVAFPLSYRGGIMQARAVSSLDELRPAMLGIPAPPDTSALVEQDSLDLIIVPALTYDRERYRLGYGGGYYDRYLQNAHAITIGLARGRLIAEALPREQHDIAVNYVVTEADTI